MPTPLPHITVCICAYRRPGLLRRTLEAVSAQETSGVFTYSVQVVDNDAAQSSRAVVEDLAMRSAVPIHYCVEPRQNIATARNTAVKHAKGDFVAFVDDDELPVREWLLKLLVTFQSHSADGVLGPVPPHFDEGTPAWVMKSRLYERPVHPTGMLLSWNQCRTGNVLLKRSLFGDDNEPFDPKCLSGEDQDFFRRKISEGHTFIWCGEAPAYEVVPPVRWRRGFIIRRGVMRGVFAQRNHGLQPGRVLQAMISIPFYTVMLPFALFLGQAVFMKCAFKLSYHAGRLMGLLRLNPIRQTYVVE